ncbi:MAG TPA: extracellular solute-binding protein [Trebonia sp.]|jgi:raffinose/stachyose/melibiose transport system substrate-binding protein|nr:extracellular solute-binding protein [Trebonia sp.]
MRSSRALAAVALAVTTATAAAACSSGSSSSTPTAAPSATSSSSASSASSATSSSSASTAAKVTLTWWNNATNQPLLGIYEAAIKGFEAKNPNVTITNVPVQNELLQDTKIPLALEGNNPPNIYQQWGGGVLGQQVTSGKVANITADVSSWIGGVSGASGWQANGQQYGVPVDLHVVGFWYRKDIFKKVGITVPTTLAQLESDDAKLRAAGYAPIAVGSKDRWPDAFWWEYFALRDCPQATVNSAIKSQSFSASCFGTASTDLATFLKTNPFQTGFLGTSSQQGAGSSAGMVASGKAVMELQGDWDPSVMEGVSTNKSLSSELGWFPFPQTPGSGGSQTAVLGGGDGFSCTGSTAQVQACADFLQYLDSPAVQAQIVGPGQTGEPVITSESSAITLPATQTAAAYFKTASYEELYFDTALPTKPGQNLDTAIANYFSSPSSSTAAAIANSPQTP